MVSLEHVKLLEDRIIRTLDHVQHVQEENSLLREKLDEYKGRIDELEVLIKTFKDDQSKIEDGILAALDRLNQFEIAVERGLSSVSGLAASAVKPAESLVPAAADEEEPAAPAEEDEEFRDEPAEDAPVHSEPEAESAEDPANPGDAESAEEGIEDLEMELGDAENGLPADTEERKDSEELDIF